MKPMLLIKQSFAVFFVIFLSFFPVLQAEEANRFTVIHSGDLKLHTFYGVSNSHIIETPNELRLIDAQMTLSDAQIVKDYIKTLNKPLVDVILSHNHPDHWFGAEVFAKDGTPVTTSANVAKDLEQGGGRFLKIMAKRLKDNMPETVIKPTAEIKMGEQAWDGLKVIVEEYVDHESHHSIVIKLPEHGVLIGQDLFYNEMFLVASDRKRNQNWIDLLESFKKNEAKTYSIILVGHGENADASIFQHNIDYLKALEATLAKGLSKEETTKMMIEQFPEKGGKGMLGISMRNLFSEQH